MIKFFTPTSPLVKLSSIKKRFQARESEKERVKIRGNGINKDYYCGEDGRFHQPSWPLVAKVNRKFSVNVCRESPLVSPQDWLFNKHQLKVCKFLFHS